MRIHFTEWGRVTAYIPKCDAGKVSHQTLLWEPATRERRIAKTAAEKQQTAQRGSSTKRLSLLSVNQGLQRRQQFTCTKNIRAKTEEQAGPKSNLSHLCCWNTTGQPTGSEVFHEKGSISEPGIKGTWTERMSRRTKWRSIIQTTTGLLKEFWETSQEKKSCDLRPYGKPGPQSRGLEAASPRLWWQSELQSSAQRWLNNQTSSETPRTEIQSVRHVHRSQVRYSAAQQTPRQGGSPYTKTTSCAFPMCIPKQQQQQHTGESLPGKEVKMRYQKRNWHLWVSNKIIRKWEDIKKNLNQWAHTQKKYGLLTTPILHTILIPRKKTKQQQQQQQQKPDSSQCSPNVCSQRHLKISAEITSKNQEKKKKKSKENNQKESFWLFPLSITGRSTLKQT